MATTLTAALQAHAAGELAGQLQYALDYRVLIERAVGYLMAQSDVDSVKTKFIIADIAGGIGIVSAVVAGYFFVTAPKSTSVGVNLLPGGGTIRWGGAF